MGWLDRLFGRKSATVNDSLALFKEIYGGREAIAGGVVNAKTALGVTTVLACARVIAEGLAQLPLKLYQEQGAAKRVASEHPLYRLLHRAPNAWQTSFEWRETMAFHAVLTGNAFCFVNRLGDGRIFEMIPLLPGRMEIRHDDPFAPPRYRFLPESGVPFDLPRAQMMHLRGPSWNTAIGLEIVSLVREAIGLAMAVEAHGARTFRNGGRVAGLLTSEAGNLTETQIGQLRAEWDKTYGGDAGSGKTAILYGGLKYQTIAMESDKAQFLETRRHQVEEIARAFRVFPQMLGYADKTATYASAEQFFLAHVVHTLNPWIERFEQVIDRDILTEADRAQGYFAKIMVQGLLRGDARTRSIFYGAGIKDGWLTRNEARAFEELDPIDGLDTPLMPLNMADGTEPPAPPAEDDPPPTPAEE